MRSNNTSRRFCTPRWAAHDSAYWAMKPAAPRSAKMPTMATGTIHSASLPPVKPWSSSGFISSGISGSVSAPSSDATNATTTARRLWRK